LDEEDDRILGSPLKTRWSYSEAKAIEEVLAYSYWREKGLPTVIVRLFNTVGPRQVGSYGMVVPRFIESALQNKPLTVYGDGTQKRCFCHVQDVISGLLMLIDNPLAEGKVFNLGSQEEISITELAKKIISLTSSTSEINYIPYDEAYEDGFEDMPRRVPGTTKVKNLTGWNTTKTLVDIVADVRSDLDSKVNT
jgi:UDP-glucose 4-epimerase